jgi:hypothetical protein
MKRPWTRNRMAGLERRLRDERPLPSEELVRRVSQDASPRTASFPRLRLGVATAVSGLALAAVVALGGLSSPIDTAARIAQFDNAGGTSNQGNNGNNGNNGKPGTLPTPQEALGGADASASAVEGLSSRAARLR